MIMHMNESQEPYSISAETFKNLQHGTIGRTPRGYSFVYAVSGGLDESGAAAGLYTISLPFTSAVHIVGQPVGKPGETITSPRNMHKVDLEGDYASYFDLYAEQGKDSQLRYVLDPEAMAYCMDFLQHCTWEIHRSSFYLYDDGALPDLSVIDNFIENITPANAHSPSYKISLLKMKEALRPISGRLKCPACNIALMKGKNWLACPEGHGYLMTGSQIVATRLDSASFEKQLREAMGKPPKAYSTVSKTELPQVICPNCTSVMSRQQYQFSEIYIDVCRTCQYRWLDGVELNTILGAYRHE
jgi:hypothetical protein